MPGDSRPHVVLHVAVSLDGATTGFDPDPTTLEIRTAGERVDLPELLRVLHRDHGVDTVRVDSGGKLAGALLDADLVDEISLLVHPRLVPADAKRWFGTHRSSRVAASSAVEHLADDLVRLSYRMTAEGSGS